MQEGGAQQSLVDARHGSKVNQRRMVSYFTFPPAGSNEFSWGKQGPLQDDTLVVLRGKGWDEKIVSHPT